MTVETSVYYSVVDRESGKAWPTVPMTDPAVLTSPGAYRLEDSATLAENARRAIWTYADRTFFKFIGIQVVSGELTVALHVDTPVSASDSAASGTNPRVRSFNVGPGLPFILSSQNARLHATLTTDAGLTGGVPNIFATPSAGTGYIYAVWIGNLTTTPAVVRWVARY